MTTAVRIKRKADQSPADSIVLAPKMPRCSDDDEGTNYTFHYAGTFKEPDSKEANETIQRVKRSKWLLREDPKQHSTDLRSKARTLQRSASRQNRLELVLQHRAVLQQIASEDITDDSLDAPRQSTHNLFRLYDVVAEEAEKDRIAAESVEGSAEDASTITCNDVPMVRERVKEPEPDKEYVYDVYFNNLQCDLAADKDFFLFQYETPFGPEPRYDSDPELEEADGEDSDSNAEDNWRNDYPDEDPDFERSADYYGICTGDFVSEPLQDLCLDLEDRLSDDD